MQCCSLCIMTVSQSLTLVSALYDSEWFYWQFLAVYKLFMRASGGGTVVWEGHSQGKD